MSSLSFILLASVALTLIATTQAANLIVGVQKPSDHLIGREAFKKPARILLVVQADGTFNAQSGETISQVRLLDQNKKGKGATATITAGGPGAKFINVHFKSQRGQSIDFVAELYGQ